MKNYKKYLVYILPLLVTAFMLNGQGRYWSSASGQVYLWEGNIWSSENSQQFFDPYSFSHVQHGFVFLGLLSLVFRTRFSVGVLLAITLVLECGWELFENSAYVIDRYRETAAQGYTGDTVLNSVMDIACCAGGFWMGTLLGMRYSVIAFILIEVTMLWLVRDSFVLNVLMLLYPFETIKAWQLGHG